MIWNKLNIGEQLYNITKAGGLSSLHTGAGVWSLMELTRSDKAFHLDKKDTSLERSDQRSAGITDSGNENGAQR